jgi:serine/threonine protein kinase
MMDRSVDGSDDRDLPPTVAAGEGTAGSADGDFVGRVLGGRYRILRKLGEGAMGAVYLGEHMKIGRQDAIKVLRDALATDPDTIARFVRGTRNVSMIRHPNICTIYDYSDIAGGVQFVAMEYVPGETLRDLLQREGKLPLGVAIHIARQSAEALDAAHEVGIVHRDLKPANIMVVPGRNGTFDVKVVDFDIAKGSSDGEGEEVTRMGFVVGTPEYMSPEQLIGDRLDGRSDIYSLGLVLFRMLTGTLPFAAEDTQDLMVKRLTEAPMTLMDALPTGNFPPALEAALRRALQRKPADRPATAGEFGREISAAIETPATVAAVGGLPPRQPTSAPTPPIADAAGSRRTLSGRTKMAGAAGVVAALAIIGVIWAGTDGEPPTTTTTPGTVDPVGEVLQYDDPLAANESDPAGGSDSVAAGNTSGEQTGTGPRVDPSVVAMPDRDPPPTNSQLLDLMERLDNFPTNAALVEVRDAAVAAWNHPQASGQTRATAAYVAGQALIPLGDTIRAVEWLQRAVELRPDYGPYTSLLQTYQQLLRDSRGPITGY